MLLSGWGRNKFINCNVFAPGNIRDLRNILSKKNNISFRGNGRSYGDSSLGKNCISSKKFKKILYFDKQKGEIETESGVTLEELIVFLDKTKWIPPVLTGTKYVTIGGLLASDCHGKNHHIDGCFSKHVKSIKLITDKKILICSSSRNKNIFNFTCGGMGLTGFIYSIKFKLKKVVGKNLYVNRIRTENFRETINIFLKSNNWNYTAAWIDSSHPNNPGRGVILRSRHTNKKLRKTFNLSFLLFASNSIIKIFKFKVFHSFVINLLNKIFYSLNRNKNYISNFNNFFFQLDNFNGIYYLYGKRGFLSYQCWFPEKFSEIAIYKIFKIIRKYKIYSFISVIKLMGKNKKRLSFGGNGFTVVFDFPNSKNVSKMLKEFDIIINQYSGNIYLTKDNRIKNTYLKKMNNIYSKLGLFRKKRNIISKFNSYQSKRIKI